MVEQTPELTILMPCLNEAETLEICIEKARTFLLKSGVFGEIVIADNGSTDGSQSIAEACGARVINVQTKGYGAALIEGTKHACGKYVIMGDADDSYDFLNLMPFIEKLREGFDLVMGNRFQGGIEPGAMPPLHRYLGNPVLSFVGRLFYSSSISDFHCGLRGYNRESMLSLHLKTTGMEYASEMVVQSTLHNFKIAEVPTTLKKDGRSRPPHLRSWHDGWRHLKFLLMHSPNWLFFYPGFILLIIGLMGFVPLLFTDISIGSVNFGIPSLLFFAAFIIIGFTITSFGYLTRLFAKQSGFIPDTKMPALLERLSLEKGLLAGRVMVIIGIGLSVFAFASWGANSGFGALNPEAMMRLTIPAVTLVILGAQIQFLSFFAGILKIEHR